jgi:periplasmic protein CpxP/Spy
MSIKYSDLRPRLLLGAAILALPLLVAAAAPDAGRPGGCDAGFHGGPPHPPGPGMGPGMGMGPMGPGPGFGGDREANRAPPFMMGLKLSDDQQDKIFNIMHAAAPQMREQSKFVRKAREALHDMTRSAQFSNDGAMTLAQAAGKAESQLAYLRTRMEHDLYVVLTPEQQAEVTKRHQEMEAHRGEGPPPR